MAQRPPSPPSDRDPLIDAARAISLYVVVVWHWVFTTIRWTPEGPHASNPIGVTRGLWLATWLFQVLPVFFFAGGYVHSRSWQRTGGGWPWVARRLKAILLPAAALVLAGVAVYVGARILAPEAGWVLRGLILVLSPLWFLVIYAVLVAGMPLWRWMHEVWEEFGIVVLLAVAVVVDVLRFRYRVAGVEWVNLVVVWAFAHQLGFHYERLVAAKRQLAQSLVLGGLVALFALTNMGLYPRSMVGVPGEEISNMAPPTLAIAALTIFQLGVLLMARDRIIAWARAGWGAKVVDVASRHAMPIFLWHAPGFAVAYGLWRLAGLPGQEPQVDAVWWAWRPLWLVLPIVPTVILASTLGRITLRGEAGAVAGVRTG